MPARTAARRARGMLAACLRSVRMKSIAASLLALLACAAGAETTVNADLSLQVQDPCRVEVSKFEQAIGFVRQNQGNRAAQDLKERLLPAKLEADILFKDGYCGLARYIREKKLNR
jgi:hypothetical protein